MDALVCTHYSVVLVATILAVQSTIYMFVLIDFLLFDNYTLLLFGVARENVEHGSKGDGSMDRFEMDNVFTVIIDANKGLGRI